MLALFWAGYKSAADYLVRCSRKRRLHLTKRPNSTIDRHEIGLRVRNDDFNDRRFPLNSTVCKPGHTHQRRAHIETSQPREQLRGVLLTLQQLPST